MNLRTAGDGGCAGLPAQGILSARRPIPPEMWLLSARVGVACRTLTGSPGDRMAVSTLPN